MALPYQSLHLYISPDALTFEPVFLDPAYPRESLVLRRADGAVILNAPPSPTLGQEEVILTHGIVGIIRLNAGDHVITVRQRERIGTICDKEIFRLTGHDILPVRNIAASLTDRQTRDDAIYIAMLNDHLQSRAFYFSYTIDITHTLQRQKSLGPATALPLWQRADDRFFWNRALVAPLIRISQQDPIRSNLSRFILPLIYGFVAIESIALQSHNLSFALVSRRSRQRAGVRYLSRGIDENGHVSNYVETEQIVEVVGAAGTTTCTAAYVQTRGSIPVFWRQPVDVRYRPPLVIEDKSSTSTAFRSHFFDQIRLYGRQIVVNLINKHGYEGPLGSAFARQVLDLGETRLRYVHFDFHHKCRKMQWHRISLLINEISDELATQRYFSTGNATTGAPAHTQSSIVRTNCIDCLDRTNVVQSVLARRALHQQLAEFGVITETQDIAFVSPDLERLFKTIWADHADAISRQYSGTGALKTDFTRTGKRSINGVIQDGTNSLVRYIRNNFLDGFRQDTLDLFLGKYQVDASRESPFAQPTLSMRGVMVLVAIAAALLIMLFALTMPMSSRSAFAWAGLSVFALVGGVGLAVKHSDEFVARPMLVADPWTAKDASGVEAGGKGWIIPGSSGKSSIGSLGGGIFKGTIRMDTLRKSLGLGSGGVAATDAKSN